MFSLLQDVAAPNLSSDHNKVLSILWWNYMVEQPTYEHGVAFVIIYVLGIYILMDDLLIVIA